VRRAVCLCSGLRSLATTGGIADHADPACRFPWSADRIAVGLAYGLPSQRISACDHERINRTRQLRPRTILTCDCTQVEVCFHRCIWARCRAKCERKSRQGVFPDKEPSSEPCPLNVSPGRRLDLRSLSVPTRFLQALGEMIDRHNHSNRRAPLRRILVIAFLTSVTSSLALTAAGDVDVLRDTWGVPHVFAAEEVDGFLWSGLRCREDRLLQMELIRRKAAGRLAEVFGPSGSTPIADARIAGYAAYAPRALAKLPERWQQALRAYAPV